MPRIDSFTSGKILKSINKRLEENGYQGIILTSELSKDKEIKHIKKLYQQGVDGIIILAVNITKEHIDLVKKLPIPILFTGQKSSLVNYIKVDDYKAGKALGQYIRDNGHRNIVFLGVTEEDKSVGVERKAGFCDAFKDIDCKISFVKTGFSFNETYEASKEVIKYKPIAVIGATDNIVLGFIRYAYEKGYSIPDEISVAGFGGYDIGLAVHPTITTVEINYEALGEKSSDLILSYINGEEIEIDRNVPLKLIKRESVKSLL